jgi:hypothetical protein
MANKRPRYHEGAGWQYEGRYSKSKGDYQRGFNDGRASKKSSGGGGGSSKPPKKSGMCMLMMLMSTFGVQMARKPERPKTPQEWHAYSQGVHARRERDAALGVQPGQRSGGGGKPPKKTGLCMLMMMLSAFGLQMPSERAKRRQRKQQADRQWRVAGKNGLTPTTGKRGVCMLMMLAQTLGLKSR